MRSQTSAARKAMWGTAERYLLLQQQSTISRPKEAAKLANLATRTESFWKAKLYNDQLKVNASGSISHAVDKDGQDGKVRNQHARQTKPQRAPPQPSPKKNKLGLTASQ